MIPGAHIEALNRYRMPVIKNSSFRRTQLSRCPFPSPRHFTRGRKQIQFPKRCGPFFNMRWWASPENTSFVRTLQDLRERKGGNNLEFAVLTVVLLKTLVFWAVTQCLWGYSFRHFETSLCLHLQSHVVPRVVTSSWLTWPNDEGITILRNVANCKPNEIRWLPRRLKS
jgi:hypothetical protein